jgi:hypothetical protein
MHLKTFFNYNEKNEQKQRNSKNIVKKSDDFFLASFLIHGFVFSSLLR